MTTCRRDSIINKYTNCVDHFPYLNNLYSKNGYAPDKSFEELRFPIDCDMNTLAIHRNVDVNQENRCRTKCITNIYQVALREERTILIETEIYRIKEVKILLHNIEINDNSICKEIIVTSVK